MEHLSIKLKEAQAGGTWRRQPEFSEADLIPPGKTRPGCSPKPGRTRNFAPRRFLLIYFSERGKEAILRLE